MSTKSLVMSIVFIDVIALTAAALTGNPPDRYFKEAMPITWLSFVQLLAVAAISWHIYTLRKKAYGSHNPRSLHILWLIIAAGFVFLAVDEIAKIHEGIDHLIHMILRMEETGLTDRIDDVIVLGYGLVGIGVLYYFRHEMKNFTSAMPLLIVGFALMFLMVATDIATNRKDILSSLVSEPYLSATLYPWLGVMEEALKILAEAALLGGFYCCLLIAKKQGTQVAN